MENEFAVRMTDIVKTFGSVIANNGVSLEIKSGEILSLLGENGSGKTTLMNMLSGIYFPDSGHIYINGEEVTIASPHDAFNLGIGMIHQHFKLVDVFTAAENLILGMEGKNRLDRKEINKAITDICDKYGFNIDPEMKVYDMSVSEKQTLEIIKVLYRGANILILDEPTAVLTPQETEKLFNVLRNMKNDGKSIIIITHKLNEVMEISDRVAVLRKGEYVGDIATKDTDPQQLTNMMVGRTVTLNINRPVAEVIKPRLQVEHLTYVNSDGNKALDDVSFMVYGGEILGIAGISGSGQKELLEAVAGLRHLEQGSSIKYLSSSTRRPERQLVGLNPIEIRKLGVALSFVPEDRLGMGLVREMGISDNMMLKSYRKGRSIFTDRNTPKEMAQDIVDKYEVKTPNLQVPVSTLSGGNIQKVLVGREIALQPKVLLTAYAVRGLDINTSYRIYNILNEQKMEGVAVVYVGEDLDVLLQLCDRIMVMAEGRVTGIVDARTATKEQLGYLMTAGQDKEDRE